MDNKKIKKLRTNINISLKRAKELLIKNDGDIFLCEEEFHKENIQEISTLTQCSFEEAKKSYLKFQSNIEKAINYINEKDVTFTIDNRNVPKNSIGFILYPLDKKKEYIKSVKRNDVFIPSKDFNLVLKVFISYDEDFDIRGLNYIDKNTCFLLIKKIEKITCKNLDEKKFLNKIVFWFEDTLSYASYILIDGNL